MGILDIFKGRQSLASSVTTTTGVLSPFADSSGLGTIILSDAFGVEKMPMSREKALRVPALMSAISLLTSQVASLPLRAINGDDTLVTNQPSWLYRTDGALSPYDRMTATIDDIIFYGHSLWLTTRGTDGYILDAAHCPKDQWTVRDGAFYIEGRTTPLDESEMILFNPLFPGLLNIASDNIEGALAVEKQWQRQVANPVPIMALKEEGDVQLDEDEVADLISGWSKARNDPNGAIGFLPNGIGLEVFGETDPEVMTTGRNATKADVAAYLSIPASMLDGSLAEASLTYVTTEGNRNRFYSDSLPTWTGPIQARLSQDDIVPRGQRVRFDYGDKIAVSSSPTGAHTED